MLHKETRELLLKAIENGTKVTDAAKAYCVNRSTVYRLVRQRMSCLLRSHGHFRVFLSWIVLPGSILLICCFNSWACYKYKALIRMVEKNK